MEVVVETNDFFQDENELINERPLMSDDEFIRLVELFYWLKTIRDKSNTRLDTLEPNYLLNSTDNEVEQLIA